MRRRTLTLILIAVALVLVVGGVLTYARFFLRTAYVPSGSMMNTIIPGDSVFIRRLSGEVKRGQLVVLQYPGDPTFYIARVVGLPGETVDLRDTAVYINRHQVNEQRVTVESVDPEDTAYNALKEVSTEGKGRYRVFYGPDRTVEDASLIGPYKIPAGHYFVMSDNRDFSRDSRYRGPVPRELISGEPFMIYFSVGPVSKDFRWNRLFKNIH